MGSLFSQVDLSLLRKYDRPGPRYTSYPTAPLFTETFTAEDFRDEIRSTNTPATTDGRRAAKWLTPKTLNEPSTVQ